VSPDWDAFFFFFSSFPPPRLVLPGKWFRGGTTEPASTHREDMTTCAHVLFFFSFPFPLFLRRPANELSRHVLVRPEVGIELAAAGSRAFFSFLFFSFFLSRAPAAIHAEIARGHHHPLSASTMRLQLIHKTQASQLGVLPFFFPPPLFATAVDVSRPRFANEGEERRSPTRKARRRPLLSFFPSLPTNVHQKACSPPWCRSTCQPRRTTELFFLSPPLSHVAYPQQVVCRA